MTTCATASLRGAKRRSNPFFPFLPLDGLLRFARNDGCDKFSTTGKSLLIVRNKKSSPKFKNILLFGNPKSALELAPSRARKRGVSRSSRTLGRGCDGRFGVRRDFTPDEIATAYGQVVWS